jgi:hypothetical protein
MKIKIKINSMSGSNTDKNNSDTIDVLAKKYSDGKGERIIKERGNAQSNKRYCSPKLRKRQEISKTKRVKRINERINECEENKKEEKEFTEEGETKNRNWARVLGFWGFAKAPNPCSFQLLNIAEITGIYPKN